MPTLRFQALYIFLVLAHDRRGILQFGITDYPTVDTTIQQHRTAFPWDVRRLSAADRDRIFGKDFVEQVRPMGIK